MVLLLVGAVIAVLLAGIGSTAGSKTIVPASAPRASASPGSNSAQIYVHVLGAVHQPGVYQFRDGDRAIDAIAAAGGFTSDADRRQVNLARFLIDGEQIYLPTTAETAQHLGNPGGDGADDFSNGSAGGGISGSKVNLNTADATALETLPRVGPSLAARILAWREANGRFSAVEDLMSVTGIGEKTFDGLKDLVTI